MNFAKSGADAIEILWRLRDWFPKLGMEKLAQLKKYHEELLKFNKTVNLISVKSIPNADLVHFSDSILASEIVSKVVGSEILYDFGSGNGFAGLVYGILYPDKKIVLYDSDQRKCEFLKHVISILGLKNVTVFSTKFESLPANSVKFGMSRGLASISKATVLSRKIFPVGGVYLHLKGEEWASEVGSMPIQVCSYWRPELVSEYKLPIGNYRLAVVKTVKIKE